MWKFTDFGLKRSWVQALVFYIFYFIIISVPAVFLAYVTASFLPSWQFDFYFGYLDIGVGSIVNGVGSTLLVYLILSNKGRLSYFSSIGYLLVALVFGTIVGGFFGLIVSAFLTTKESLISDDIKATNSQLVANSVSGQSSEIPIKEEIPSVQKFAKVARRIMVFTIVLLGILFVGMVALFSFAFLIGSTDTGNFNFALYISELLSVFWTLMGPSLILVAITILSLSFWTYLYERKNYSYLIAVFLVFLILGLTFVYEQIQLLVTNQTWSL